MNVNKAMHCCGLMEKTFSSIQIGDYESFQKFSQILKYRFLILQGENWTIVLATIILTSSELIPSIDQYIISYDVINTNIRRKDWQFYKFLWSIVYFQW